MTETKCDRCAGCGRIANDDEGTPWKYWAELPVQSAIAVVAGIVRPLPCPECGGSGKKLPPVNEEVGCTVDWQHVAKQCREALDGADGMVTIHRGALSLALVAVEQFIAGGNHG